MKLSRKNKPMELKKYSCSIPWCSYKNDFPGQIKSHVEAHINNILADDGIKNKTRRNETGVTRAKIVVNASIEFECQNINGFVAITTKSVRIIVKGVPNLGDRFCF